MNTPNWQHHSKKEQKRKLKPQALRQAKARRQALKKSLLKRDSFSINKIIEVKLLDGFQYNTEFARSLQQCS
jgi:hypothetical protein